MRKRFVTILIGVEAIFCAVSCSTELAIVHLNDTHSHFEPVRDEKRTGEAGIIERSIIIDSIRTARGEDHVLLLHAGDFNQGTSYFTQFGGALEVAAVNALRYDCVTLGNHEFDNGVEDLAGRLRNLNCPVVCANLKLEGTALEGVVTPYTIIRRGGHTIGIIGLVSDLKTNVSYFISSKLVQYDAVEVVNRYASELRSRKCDMVIVLSHLGFGGDLHLASMTEGVDMIIGGHTHTFIDDIHYVTNPKGKRIPVVQDGCWGYDVGELIVK